MYLSPLAFLYISNVCPPNPFAGADSIAWKGAKDGVLTVSEAYARRVESTWDGKDPVWQQIWTLKCPQRVRSFLWLICKEKLLTNVERKRRTLTTDELCQICHAPQESILHILRDCKEIISVWKRLMPLDNQGVFFAHDFVNWFLANINKNRKFKNETFNWNTIFSIVCWFAWKQRNDFVFNDVTQEYWDIYESSLSWARHADVGGPIRRHQMTRTEQRVFRWQPPARDWRKLNVDGAWDAATGLGKAGGVIRSENGAWIIGFHHYVGISSVFMSELWALYDGLVRAWNQGFRRLEVVSDNSDIIRSITGRSKFL
ncbi:hypothetical protein Gotur_023843 [Gossypium turneri]